VIQVYEGLVYMDFAKHLMDSRGYGEYERLDPSLLPNIYLAYRTSLSEGTEVFHNNVRERWNAGDPAVRGAMEEWAAYAERGREALMKGDGAALGKLIDANFDLRASIYTISQGNLDMIQTARSVGATSSFSGSGGAVTGTFEDDRMFRKLEESYAPMGIKVIRPKVNP
jgi:glucuronokinase